MLDVLLLVPGKAFQSADVDLSAGELIYKSLLAVGHLMQYKVQLSTYLIYIQFTFLGHA